MPAAAGGRLRNTHHAPHNTHTTLPKNNTHTTHPKNNTRTHHVPQHKPHHATQERHTHTPLQGRRTHTHTTLTKKNTHTKNTTDVQDKQLMQYPLTLRSKWKIPQRHLKIPKSESPDIWIHLTKHKWKPQSFLSKGICTVILWQDCSGKGNLGKFFWNTVGKKF